MAKRLPMCLPLIAICGIARAKGESPPVAIASSQGRSIPSDATCARKSPTVLSVGMRTSLSASGIYGSLLWPFDTLLARKEGKVGFAPGLSQQQERQFADVI